jgi:hypothetical protein
MNVPRIPASVRMRLCVRTTSIPTVAHATADSVDHNARHRLMFVHRCLVKTMVCVSTVLGSFSVTVSQAIRGPSVRRISMNVLPIHAVLLEPSLASTMSIPFLAHAIPDILAYCARRISMSVLPTHAVRLVHSPASITSIHSVAHAILDIPAYYVRRTLTSVHRSPASMEGPVSIVLARSIAPVFRDILAYSAKPTLTNAPRIHVLRQARSPASTTSIPFHAHAILGIRVDSARRISMSAPRIHAVRRAHSFVSITSIPFHARAILAILECSVRPISMNVHPIPAVPSAH